MNFKELVGMMGWTTVFDTTFGIFAISPPTQHYHLHLRLQLLL